MDHLEIIGKLKHTKRIQPEKEFSGFSKSSILTNADIKIEGHLANKLNLLKSISPSAEFALDTKLRILEEGRITATTLKELFSRLTPKNIAFQFTNYGVAVGMTVVLIGIIATGGYKYFYPSSELAALDNRTIATNEENALSAIKDIDTHLKEVEYYASASKQTTVALNEASMNSSDHLNNALIEKESQKTDFQSPENKDIKSLLERATL